MANDTFAGIANKVLLRCPSVPLTLARDWVQSSFRDIVERRRWSWLIKTGQLYAYDAYETGTATVTAGTSTVTITTGVVSADHVGRQFRISGSLPIRTITEADTSANTYTLDQDWWPSTQTAQTYKVYQAYVALPSDFHSFVSVIAPATAQSLAIDKDVAYLDANDPQRGSIGSTPRRLCWRDYYNGVARYELWPHQTSAAVFPIIYESRPTDPYDAGASVPSLLPSDVILERALMYCAMWPGASIESPNPYYSGKLGLAVQHQREFERRIGILEKQDNEHMQQNVWYQADQRQGGAVISSQWMQEHGPDAY